MKQIILFIFSIVVCGSIHSQTVKIAAAAGLRYVFEEIKTQYEADFPNSSIQITFGSSGALTQQILNGADFDLFYAADSEFPEKVANNGFAGSAVETYIYGKLVVWSSTLDVSRGLEILTEPSVKKIAIADPKKASYGKSAVKLLKNQKIYDSISSKIIWGDNINQTAQFAFSGNAELGLIALSIALSPAMEKKGKYYIFPEDICPLQGQSCVSLKGAKNNREAAQFKSYLTGGKCDGLWLKYGYVLVKKQ
jgi:molybdate transport system substrate-binding protein